jgi:hypothetical protein
MREHGDLHEDLHGVGWLAGLGKPLRSCPILLLGSGMTMTGRGSVSPCHGRRRVTAADTAIPSRQEASGIAPRGVVPYGRRRDGGDRDLLRNPGACR